MAKTNPQELWDKHLLERFIALKHSRDLLKLKAKGLNILGRKKMFKLTEWTPSFNERISTPGYIVWCNGDCQQLGDRFGLASWVVTMTCLVRGYNPQKDRLAIESDYPQIRVVTDNSDKVFVTKLAFEAQKLGLSVVYRHASNESVLILPGYVTDVPAPAEKPSLYSAFQMRIEVPTGYPHDAARKLQGQATRLQRELLIRLGYDVPQRLRISSSTALAPELKIKEKRLAVGTTYNIIDKLYKDDDLSLDQQRRTVIKVKRHRLKKRLHQLENSK